jgi:hypothetical protein
MELGSSALFLGSQPISKYNSKKFSLLQKNKLHLDGGGGGRTVWNVITLVETTGKSLSKVIKHHGTLVYNKSNI